MGCVLGRRVFKVNPFIEGQDETALEVFLSLGLSKREIDLFYTAFWDIDADSSGHIRPSELFSYFEVEETPFEVALFSIFDEDKSGLINFMEFVCTLWNILTLPVEECACIAYLIKDPTADATITYSDVKSLIEMMNKRKVDKDPVLGNYYQAFRKEYPPEVTLQHFLRFTKDHPSITSSLRMLQLHLRRQIVGEKFWSVLTTRRKEAETEAAMEGEYRSQLNYVKKIAARVVANKAAFHKRQLAEEAERKRLNRIGKGKEGDSREVIMKQQSRLMSFFNLKKSRWGSSSWKANNASIVPEKIMMTAKGGKSVPSSGKKSAKKPKLGDDQLEEVAGLGEEIIGQTSRSKKGATKGKRPKPGGRYAEGEVGEEDDGGNAYLGGGTDGGVAYEYNPNVHLFYGNTKPPSPNNGESSNINDDGNKKAASNDGKKDRSRNRRRRSTFKPNLLL